MARQHVHNRRAGHGNGGFSWISYSDIMAALVLVFVLFLVYNLYHYNQLLTIKTREIEQQQALVVSQQNQLEEQAGILIVQQANLDAASAALTQAQLDLAARENELKQQTIIEHMKQSGKHAWIRSESWDEQVGKLYKEREPAYRKTADVVIPADGKTVEEIAEEIAAREREADPA